MISADDIPWKTGLAELFLSGGRLLTWPPSVCIDSCVMVLSFGVTDASVGDRHRELLEPLKLTIETLLGTCRLRTRTERTMLEVSTLPSVIMLLGCMLELSSAPTVVMLLPWRYTTDGIMSVGLNGMLVLLSVLWHLWNCNVVELILLFGRMLIMVMCPYLARSRHEAVCPVFLIPLAVTRLIPLAKTCLLTSISGQLILILVVLLGLSLSGSQTRLLITVARELRSVLSLFLCEHNAGLMTICRLSPPVLATTNDESRVKHDSRRLGTVSVTTLASL